MLKTLTLLMTLWSGSAFAAPIPPVGRSGIDNSGAPQNAQFNVGTGTVRGLLTTDRIETNSLNTGSFSATSLAGDGSGILNLDAGNLATGVVPAPRLVGVYSGVTGVGTVATGVWHGSPVPVKYGGTGLNWEAAPAGNIPVFTGTGVMGLLPSGTPGFLLQSNGSGFEWTGAPGVLGTNIVDIPVENLLPGDLPNGISIDHTAISSFPAVKVIGDIAGKASGLTSPLPISDLAAGTLPTTIPASSITATGVTPGTYGGGPYTLVQLDIRPDGRIGSASQQQAAIPPTNITAGLLPLNVGVPAANIQGGILAAGVTAQSLLDTGVSSGTYGSSTHFVQIHVNQDGRISSVIQYQAQGISTSTAWVDRYNNWTYPQTSQSSWTILNDFEAQDVTATYFHGDASLVTGITKSQVQDLVLTLDQIATSTNALTAYADALGVSTASLQSQINTLNIDTGTIMAALQAEILRATQRENLLGDDTGYLRTDLTFETNRAIARENLLGDDTGYLRTDLTFETNRAIARENLLGDATGLLRTDLTFETNRAVARENLLGDDTGYLRTDLTQESLDRVAADATKVNLSSAGVAYGFATLDGSTKIPFSQLPSALMSYLGAWDATNNSPHLVDGDPSADNGDTYRVSVAGSTDTGHGVILYYIGDFIIYNGSIWERAPAADGVTMVNTKTGAVTLYTDDISELGPTPTNKWFTVERATAALQPTTDAIALSTTTLYQQINSTAIALTNEIARAQQAESDLLGFINSTGSALTSEIARAQQAESDLLGFINSTGSALTSEIARAQQAESDLLGFINSTGSALTSEIADRIAADATKVPYFGSTSYTDHGAFGVAAASFTATTGVAIGTTTLASNESMRTAKDGFNIVNNDAYSNTSSEFGIIRNRRAGGTKSAPTATQSGHGLGAFQTRGHTGTNFGSAGTMVQGVAAENWTSSAQGSSMTFFTTPNGTASQSLVLTLGQDASAVFSGNLTAQSLRTSVTGNTSYALTASTGIRINAGGLTYPDGTISTTAVVNSGGGGHKISTGTGEGPFTQLVQRSTLTFDSAYFRVDDDSANDMTGVSMNNLFVGPAALPTRQVFLSGSGTYTTPSDATSIRVRMVGGGGGSGGRQGAGSCSPAPTAGGTTSFGSVSANGGSPGEDSNATSTVRQGGAGGTGGSGTASIRAAGSYGHGGADSVMYIASGGGGSAFFGDGAKGNNCSATANAVNGAANTGGGAAAGCITNYGGGGGGGGESVELVISNPAASYSYTVGAGGSGSTCSSVNGGSGGSGIIVVDEFYSPRNMYFGVTDVAGVKEPFLHKVDGVTKTFTLGVAPSSSTVLEVFLNGITLGTSDYTFVPPNQVVFATAPAASSTMAEFHYRTFTSTLPAVATQNGDNAFSGVNTFAGSSTFTAGAYFTAETSGVVKTSGKVRMEAASVDQSCTSSPCTLAWASGGVQSITWGGTGDYTINYNAFGDNPACTCSNLGTAESYCRGATIPGTTSWRFFVIKRVDGALADNGFSVICVGAQ
jgi:hypothetical protein